MLNPSLCSSGAASLRGPVCPQITEARDDGPPGSAFILRFFASHKAKMFLLGVSAVSLAMILIGLNLFSVGIALPFSLHISLSLLGLGVAAIVTSCAVNLAGIAPTQEPERRDVEPGSTSGNSVSQPKKIRPRGHRAFSRYFSRQIRHAPANTQKKTG